VAFWAEAAIFVASVVAGLINSIAGGGTLVSFPVLVWAGRNPVLANATNTVALLPASLAGAFGFRRELANGRRWIRLLAIPSLGGGLVGAFLLLRTPERLFAQIVPFLILAATLLLASQEVLTKDLLVRSSGEVRSPAGLRLFAALLFQTAVGIYGGYFGAGIGILMLAALALLGLSDIHQMNGLKNLMAICINGVAAAYFVFSGAVLWNDVMIMATGSLIGGFMGARLARVLGRTFVRRFVITVGITMTLMLAFWKK